MPRIGDEIPDFVARSTKGEVNFHKDISQKYALIFSHPQDFTPVCLTELAEVEKLIPEFEKRNTRVFALSVDSVTNHENWEKDIIFRAGKPEGSKLSFPMIGDENLQVAKKLGMLAEGEQVTGTRTPVDNKTARTVFLIGPDKKIRVTLTYPMTTGRNFQEILRVLDSIQLNDVQGVATPEGWKSGDQVIIPPSLSEADAREKYGNISIIPLPSEGDGKKAYLRYISDLPYTTPAHEQNKLNDEL